MVVYFGDGGNVKREFDSERWLLRKGPNWGSDQVYRRWSLRFGGKFFEQFLALLECFASRFVMRKNFQGGAQTAAGLGNISQLELADPDALPGAIMIGIECERA